MDRKIEAYFGLSVGIILITVGFMLLASGIKSEQPEGDLSFCFLGMVVVGIISIVFGLYDYDSWSKSKKVLPPQQQHPQNVQVKHCVNCGAQLPVQSKFCNQCGNKVN